MVYSKQFWYWIFQLSDVVFSKSIAVAPKEYVASCWQDIDEGVFSGEELSEEETIPGKNAKKEIQASS